MSNPNTFAIKSLLLTDLVDSTKLFSTLGDERAAAVSNRHDRIARELLASFGGREIDKTDGFLFLFERPIDAARYSLRYHQALDALGRELGIALAARAGIHLGEVILRENRPEDVARGAKPLEVEGLAKPMAARVMSLAQGCQTLMTRAAFDLARRGFVGSAAEEPDIRFVTHGLYAFKGVEEPAEIGEVGIEGFSRLTPPPDSEKAWRAGGEEAIGWRPAQGVELPQRPGWVVMEKLGEGAYGEVWLVRQSKSGVQRVFKFCFDPENLRALRHEVVLFQLLRDALGDREDIGRILDWQLDEPPYFLESEYAEGGSLPTWAEEQGGLLGVSLEMRLDVVCQVADSLSDAHAIGVLHKDIKPANILVRTDRDGRPRARLIDFGIGAVIDRKAFEGRNLGIKVTDSILVDRSMVQQALSPGSGSSKSSSGSGTYVYVAPELFEGKRPTVQSDIYSLGVVLFQIVAGNFRRTIAPGWEREIEDELLRDDIARCVDGSPERRFGSASELAERLRTLAQRHEERDQAESTRREAEAARAALGEQKRRRRQLTVVATVSLVFVVTVSVLALKARSRAREAEESRQRAEQLINFMLFDLNDALRPLNRLDLLRKVAQKTRAYYEAMPDAESNDETLRNRGLAIANIGEIQWQQGATDEALTSFQQAHAIATRLAAKDGSNRDWRRDLARSLGLVGDGLRARGQYDEALARYREALVIRAALAKLEPDSVTAAIDLAEGHHRVGQVLLERGSPDEALAEFQAALALCEPLVKANRDRSLRHRLAIAENDIGEAHAAKGLVEQALAAHSSALVVLEELSDEDPANATWRDELANTYDLVGLTREMRGDLDGQLEAYRAALETRERLAAEDPRNPVWQAALARSQFNLGVTLMYEGSPADGLAAHREALAIREALFARDPGDRIIHAQLAVSQAAIGDCLREQGSFAAALESYQTAAKTTDDVLGPSPSLLESVDRASLDAATGEVLLELGRTDEARKLLAGALEAARAKLALDPANVGVRGSVAGIELANGRLALAVNDSGGARALLESAAATSASLVEGGDDVILMDIRAQSLMLLDRPHDAKPVVDKLLGRRWSDPDFLELCRKNGFGQ